MTPWLQTLRGWFRAPRKPPAAAAPAPAPADLSLVACASVVIPALNEAARIADVVRHALADPATAEVIVIDDSSIDDTVALARQAGATVVTSSMLGKGASMRDGVGLVRRELVVYLDGDLAGLRHGIVSDLSRPLVQGTADFVKARFGRSGGRVTELTAKPMLQVFFPELAHLAQPLGGLIAARTALLKTLRFEDGYGVDIGLLLDAHAAGARLAEVDIGSLEHDSQPLRDLTAMANEVTRVIYTRARQAGRLHVAQITAMVENQRLATATLDHVLSRRRGRQRLLLLELDDAVTPQCFVAALAEATGQAAALAQLRAGAPDADSRRTQTAALFRFVHRQQFERVAHALPLRPGVVEAVNRLRRAGFMVGLVSDSYFVAAEILRRRIFADFALANMLQFDGEVCQGRLQRNAAFLPLQDGVGSPGLHQVVPRLRQEAGAPPLGLVWAVGGPAGDAALLRAADRGFMLLPDAAAPAPISGVTRLASFEALLAQVDALQTAAPAQAA